MFDPSVTSKFGPIRQCLSTQPVRIVALSPIMQFSMTTLRKTKEKICSICYTKRTRLDGRNLPFFDNNAIHHHTVWYPRFRFHRAVWSKDTIFQRCLLRNGGILSHRAVGHLRRLDVAGRRYKFRCGTIEQLRPQSEYLTKTKTMQDVQIIKWRDAIHQRSTPNLLVGRTEGIDRIDANAKAFRFRADGITTNDIIVEWLSMHRIVE